MELKKHWKIIFSRDEQHFVQRKSKSIFLKLKAVLIFDCDGVTLDSEVIADRILLEHLSNLLNPFPNNLFPGSDSLKEWLSKHSGQSDKEIINQFSELTRIESTFDFKSHFKTSLVQALKDEVKPIEGMKKLLQSLNEPWWWLQTVLLHA